MRYYFAPLEGITDRTYRQLHHRFFPGLDRYYTPFFSPTCHRQLTSKESRELPPADTLGYTLVPQVLTKVSDDFIWFAEQCRDLGYEEVNLNLGCPSGTVTAKGKGSGMLKEPEKLEEFLDCIYHSTPLPVSIKTRIGFETPEEFPRLLEIFNRYPVKELIVHPRVRQDFYKGTPNMEVFRQAVENSKNPLCYNGDLNSIEDIAAFSKDFPSVQAVMTGRGLVGNPGMLTPGATVENLEKFHDTLMETYATQFGSEKNTMFRMKEHWFYLLGTLHATEKQAKALRKATSVREFRAITKEIFHNV
ncbi:MAG: tRNA-dihydrouridine synthase family protein [Oscillospiraceae bacterium]|nr:tRNA-dihydrouridine synthase family protein [Oscillospiraceae bacterium]